MKVRKLKTRIAAFGLAVLMGISTLSSANAFAAEQTGSEQQTEVQAVTSQKDTSVTADDITKAVSDETFAVETSMEGIHYDAEKEDVTLVSIKDENGGEYHSDKAGTYIATYMVVPKDKSDSYTITRKVTLTDTEGQAHSEENGGEKQKSDTESEDDSDSPVQNYTDVEIETSEEDASAQAIKELKEDIEEGNVMVLSAAERATSSGSTVTLTKGRTIYYPSYIGNYLTCLFTVNGKIAYCLQSQKASPPSGSYVAQVLDSNKNLQKVLYYGYGGAGDLTGSYLSGKTEDEKYVYTHIAASYAYAGEAGFTGCNYNDLVNAGVIAYINYLFGQEEPPKGELSLSSTKLNAVRDGNIQKTPNITLSGDHRNYVTLSVPENVTAHNLSKGTSVTNGKIQIYGGDTFYLSADLLLTGSYASGNLYGSVGKTWRTLVLTTGDSKQDIGVFESETAAPVSFSVQWLNMTRIELMKKDVNTQNPLSGAVYGIYTDKKCENLLMTMSATGTDGKAVSDYFDSALKTVYVKEITAPTGYKLNTEVYKVAVTAGKTMTVTATDERVTGKVKIAKIDKETLAFKAQGDSVLRGAVYGLYAKEDIVHPDGTTGVLYKQDSLIAQGVIGDDGTLEFSELYLGEMYVKEITPPEGYTLDTTKYEVSVTYEGQDVAEVTRDLTVKEQVKKQAFQLIKISEDGEQTETDLVAGAGFKVYLISDLTQVKNGKLKPANGESYTASDFKNYDFSKEQVAVTYENGTAVPVPELITDTKGYAVSPELPYGSYVVVESTTPENLKTIDPFVVNVENDSREPMQWRVFDDRPFEFLLKIVKKDAQTGNTVLKAGASYKIYDVTNKKYVEQVVQYPKKEKISVFETNEEGYLITPQELKCSTYRIEEVKAPEGFVRQGSEESLYDGTTIISPLEQTTKGTYLKIYDTVKQQHIYQQMQTLNGKRIYEWKYQNKIYFLKYYPEKEIAETFETSYKTNLLVWDFTQNCSEVLKKQIFYTLSRIIANTSMSKAYRNVRLKSLKLLYDSCVQLNITDIGLLEMEQVETILKNFPETSQRSILGECRRDAFMQQEQIQWEANVWYLERLHLGKHRIDESKSLISISFMEIKEIQNREILQAYMKYELGITGQAVSTIVRRFVCIRNFIELLEQEKILAIHATVAEVKKYADGLRERGMQAKGFNERIFGIGHFYKFMEVKQYITRMPFRIEYFQQKEVIVHHDRSVEETVYMEILKKLYLFPERLRCMFLHLWCLGLRASEVCTLKGNAYYQQGEDYWIQVYQVKMKNYKRIPIPQALYQIMKVYLKKHEIQPEEFIFKNSRGGACLYGTFRTQMIEACRENKIANGEYLFQSHDYRHTVATMFYDSHVSLQSIRDYLGHTYEEMTRQYIDYMPQRIAKANDEFFEMQGSSLASWLKKEEKDGK